MTNVSTHGAASDVVDEEAKNDVTADPVISLPVKPF